MTPRARACFHMHPQAALEANVPPEALARQNARLRNKMRAADERAEQAHAAERAAVARAELARKEGAALQGALDIASEELARIGREAAGETHVEREGFDARLLLSVAEHKQELAELTIALAERTREAAASEEGAAELRDVLSRERAERADLGKQLEAARAEADQLRAQAARAREAAADARQAASQAQAGTQAAAAEAVRERVRNEEMAAALEEARRVHRSDVAVLRAAAAEQQASAARAADAQAAELHGVQAQLGKAAEEHERKRRELKAGLDARVAALDRECASLRAAAEDARRAEEDSAGALRSAERRVAERAADADAAKAACAQSERVAELAERGRDNLARQVSALEAAARLAAEERTVSEGALRVRLEDALRALAERTSERDRAKEAAQAAASAAAEAEARADGLGASAEALRADIAELRAGRGLVARTIAEEVRAINTALAACDDAGASQAPSAAADSGRSGAPAALRAHAEPAASASTSTTKRVHAPWRQQPAAFSDDFGRAHARDADVVGVGLASASSAGALDATHDSGGARVPGQYDGRRTFASGHAPAPARAEDDADSAGVLSSAATPVSRPHARKPSFAPASGLSAASLGASSDAGFHAVYAEAGAEGAQ